MRNSSSNNLPSAIIRQPRRVYVLVFPEFVLLDASGPIQVFATTNTQANDMGLPQVYEIQAISENGGSVPSSSGIRIDTEPLPPISRLRDSILIVAGIQDPAPYLEGHALCDWLHAAHKVTARTCSVCTGAFLLAVAGLLDDRDVTTHWMDAALLQRRFPRVMVDSDAIYIRDGRLWTSAGISAGIDLALGMVEEDCGRDMAMKVARRLVVFLRRAGGQRQYSAELRAQVEEETMTGRLAVWLGVRLDRAVTVEEMADAMSVSPRTLHRRIEKETGLTPAVWLRQLRLEAACRLLATPELTIKQIAIRSGFGSEYNLRRAFNQELRVTPSAYRALLV